MDLRHVDELKGLLPVDWFLPPSAPKKPTTLAQLRQVAIACRASLPHDPMFGWRFAMQFAAHSQALPVNAAEEREAVAV